MRYNDALQIKLYKYENNAFVVEAIIDDYQEISFSHNLYEAGDFTITINYNIPNALKFERGLFVQFGNDAYMFGEIQRINDAIGSDGKGSQIRTITGKDARYLLKRRIIKNFNNEENWAMTAKGEICLRELVKAQCGSGAETKRQLPIINNVPQVADAIGKEYSVAESFSNLYDTLVTIATQSEIGWRIKFDGNLTLECFQGSDLSAQVQFSTNFDSLANGEFTDSAEAFANTIYVGGKGTGSDRDIYEGESAIEGESPSGLDRYEAWDNQSAMTTESEYEAEALSMLTQYGQTITVNGNGLAECPYIFKEQYDIGDTITLAFSGKSAKAQILSVTEHWTWGQYGIEFSFGKPQNDLARQLQLILKQIQKASNKTTTTSSVHYYELPTETVMPKADVIYDTIGFIGDVGNGATFRLYLDNEKTGAKTYHVYFKQLAGTGKLTLTTGKAGATDLVMNVGTYVAIIYVDAQGNITNTASTATNDISLNNTQPATSNGVAQALQNKVNTDTYTNTNLNTLINTGFYPVNCNLTDYQAYNFPAPYYGTVLVGTTPSNNLMQMFMSDVGQLVYVRNCTTNVWSSWKKVLNTDDVTDTVASNNMNSVTSNGVYNALNSSLSWLLCSEWTKKINFYSGISPAQMASMTSNSPTWTLTYGKDYLQMVNVTWEDHQYHSAPAGAGGIFIPSYNSNGGTLILVDYPSTRFLFNVWIDSNRWSGWHYVDLAAIVFS